MKAFCMAAVLATSVASAGMAAAQVVQSYIYDGNGRLIRAVTDDGSTATGTAYVLDDADNRSSRATTTSSPLRSARAPAEEPTSAPALSEARRSAPPAAPQTPPRPDRSGRQAR